MKKLKNLYQRAAIKTKLIILAIIVLWFIITYAEGQATTGDPLGQTAEKYEIALTQPTASPWENGTNQKNQMSAEKRGQISTNTQKAMRNSEIAIKQSKQVQMKPARPLNQNDSVAITRVQTTVTNQERTELDTRLIESTEGSEKAGLPSVNKQINLVYIGVLLVLLLTVFLFLLGKKAKNKGSGTKKE